MLVYLCQSLGPEKQTTGKMMAKKRKKHKTKHNRENLLEYLRDLGQRLGHTPRVQDILKDGHCSPDNYYHYFNSLAEAQKLAGFKPNKVGGMYVPNKLGGKKRK